MSPSCQRRVLSAAAFLLAVTVAGCGTPPELRPTPGAPFPGASRSSAPPETMPSPIEVPTGPVTPAAVRAAPSPSGFSEAYAVPCRDKPTGAQVVRVLRRDGDLLPPAGRVSIDTGPLCAGTWQYTVVAVPGREPLAVVTRGRPGALRLVTAGTSVCSSIPVRVQAPPGIRGAAACT